MDPEVAAEQNAAVEPSPAVGEKRPIENGDVSACKKPRRDGGLKRVAEIVLVLAAMGKMRGGGRNPTAAETALMAEAREALAGMCEEMAPKDFVGGEAIENVIEELGLARFRENKLGFRPTRMSISEKISFVKKKMEDPKKLLAPLVTYGSQSLQTNVSGSTENRGASPAARFVPSDRPSHATVSSGGFPVSSPPAHVTAAGSTPSPHQLATNDVKPPMMSSGLPSGNLGRDPSFAFPRVERPQIKLDGGSNVASYVPQGPANSSANHPLVNAPTWSVQAQPAVFAKSGQENKVLNHNPTNVEGSAGLTMPQMASQVARDQTFRPFITQTATGTFPSMHQPVQSMNFSQAPPYVNNHNEIARIVQKLLQPKLPARPTWIPPSREYMNKALTCQTCKLTVNEVETVLLCDACEKGFHLKCLQANNQKGIPRGEWHCARCLSFCNGKPLPPKYGRVMRSINAPKLASSTSEAQPSSEKKMENPEPKVNHENVTANGSSGLQTPAVAGTMHNNSVESASDPKVTKANSTKQIEVVSASLPVAKVSEGPSEHSQTTESSSHEDRKDHASISQPPDTSTNTVSNKADHSHPSDISQDVQKQQEKCAGDPSSNCLDESSGVKDSENCSKGDIDCSVRSNQNEQDATQANPAGNSEASSAVSSHAAVSSDGLHAVEWTSDVLQVADGRKFYQSCCVNGITYKVQDHALVHSGQDKLMPSKLQAMWEDAKTGSKWVVVKRCYFPGDLPEAIVHPCPPEGPEGSEVYESNNDSTVMASSIQGPCEVLAASEFKEESERRSQLGDEANKELKPIFLCKWLYDEFKGSFELILS